ncbi:MAG: RidA family protein [Desulfobacula sp.]|nr:RidA family protein [Desulfobacula sp.]
MSIMDIQKINCNKWIAKFTTLSHAVIAGDFIYVSGMLGTKQNRLEIVEGGIATEVESILYHMSHVLKACDAQFQDIIKINAYLTDIDALDQLNGAYLRIISWDPPALTATGINELTLGASVIMDCVAYKPQINSFQEITPVYEMENNFRI